MAFDPDAFLAEYDARNPPTPVGYAPEPATAPVGAFDPDAFLAEYDAMQNPPPEPFDPTLAVDNSERNELFQSEENKAERYKEWMDRGHEEDLIEEDLPTGAGFATSESIKNVGRELGDVALGVGKGIVSVPKSIVGLADIPTLGLAGKMAEKVGIDFATTEAFFDSYMSEESKMDHKAVQEADGFFRKVIETAKHPRIIRESVIESAPGMLGGAAIGKKLLTIFPKLAPLIASAIGEGLVSAGQSGEDVRRSNESGYLSPKQSLFSQHT